nr:acyltransferase [Prevotella sp.]
MMNMNMTTDMTKINSIDNLVRTAVKQPRQSGIELLRIVAMLMVIIVHIYPGTIGFSYQRMHDAPFSSINSFMLESLSIVCVNVFVFISGWFGIKKNLQSIGNLCFQALFFAMLIYGVLWCLSPQTYGNIDALSTIFMWHTDDYWFVKAYLGLVIFSPMLNSFTERCSEKQLRGVLIAFYSFQTLYAWMSIYGAIWFAGGYSATSFVGLYLLAYYMRHYASVCKQWDKKTWLVLFFGIAFLQALLASWLTWHNILIAGRLFTYTNPLVIVQTVALFMFFSQLKMKSKVVNKLALSCLAVYLLHAHPLVLHTSFRELILDLDAKLSPYSYACSIALLFISIFIIAFLLDQIRLYLYQQLYKIGRNFLQKQMERS